MVFFWFCWRESKLSTDLFLEDERSQDKSSLAAVVFRKWSNSDLKYTSILGHDYKHIGLFSSALQFSVTFGTAKVKNVDSSSPSLLWFEAGPYEFGDAENSIGRR